MDGFVAGGYFLTKLADRPEWVRATSDELLPGRLFSSSACVSGRLPGIWAHDWAKPAPDPALQEWGIDSNRLPEIQEWVGERYMRGVKWETVFASPALAREFVRRFVGARGDLVLFGLGLHEADVGSFLEDTTPVGDMGAGGVYETILAGQPMAEGGLRVGFEPLEDDSGSGQFHSWLCNGVEQRAFEVYGVRPNQHGFIDHPEDAERIADAINQDLFPAEPGLWLPWLVVTYPLDERLPR